MSVSVKRKIAIGLLIMDLLLIMYMFMTLISPMYYVSGTNIIVFLFMIGIIGIIGVLILFKTIEKESIKYQIMSIIEKIVFLLYIVSLVYIMIFSRIFDGYYNSRYEFNVVPFRGMFDMISKVINNELNKGIMIENFIGNLIMFIPMVIFIDLVFKMVQNKSMCISVSLGICILLEGIQCFSYIGAFDIDDIILNLGGMIIAYCIIKTQWYYRLKKKLYL